MDSSIDTVSGPGEGAMPDHDNPKHLEAYEPLTKIESPDAEPEDDSRVRHPIWSNWGQLPAKYSNYVVKSCLLSLPFGSFEKLYFVFLCF